MKKIVLMIIVMIISTPLFSLDHGVITGFEIGYNFNNMKLMSLPEIELQEDLSQSLYIELKTGYRIEDFRIIGTYTNTMHPIELDSYNPVEDRFRIDVNYTFKNLVVGFFHFCDHPVTTQADQRDVNVNFGQRAFYISYYREF